MSFQVEGAKVVVTGAARGIGLAISQRFKELGATVCGWDLDLEAMQGNPVFNSVYQVDVTDENSVNMAAQQSIKAMDGVTVMVANAGVNGSPKPSWEYTLEEWNQVLSVDLTGVFLSTRSVVKYMRDQDYGRIIVIASIAGKEGNAWACPYGSAKAGAIGYVKGLAKELVPGNVTVNAIAPVITETDLFNEMTPEYIAEKKALIPMGRFCTAREIADMTAWVASPLCAFTTGQVFDVSGGRATY